MGASYFRGQMNGGKSIRRVHAIVACAIWLLGVVGLPALHEAHHHDDHTHDASGAISWHDHDHEAEVDEHHGHDAEVEHHATHDDDEPTAIDHPVGAGHQAAGIAHHAVALLQPALPALPPAPDAIELRDELAIADQTEPRLPPPAARGPPTHA